jgi:predicted ArsR family transcriptional regulator
MDLFDKQILAVLRNGESKKFQQILKEVSFSHNTLKLHIDRLKHQGMIVEAKNPKNGPGRPFFTYSLSAEVKNRVAITLTEPYTTIVSLTFQKLKHVCRFEKGGYCKNMRKSCDAQNCPQIIKDK